MLPLFNVNRRLQKVLTYRELSCLSDAAPRGIVNRFHQHQQPGRTLSNWGAGNSHSFNLSTQGAEHPNPPRSSYHFVKRLLSASCSRIFGAYVQRLPPFLLGDTTSCTRVRTFQRLKKDAFSATTILNNTKRESAPVIYHGLASM